MIWKSQRRKKLFAQPLSAGWQRIVQTHCPYYQRLSAADQRELQGHIQIFLAEKRFEGCDGFSITDEVRVCIAANACLLLLHRQTDYFPGLVSILIYPESYLAPFTQYIGHGVLTEGHQARSGETWPHGSLVLAWAEIVKNLAAGGVENVILHEFAHQLDYEDGYADGAPVLVTSTSPDGTHRTRQERYAAWGRVMKTEYERLCASIHRSVPGQPPVLRAYGATNPAEFFAVATESFFGNPHQLLAQHPELYAELKWYFQQDPASTPA